MQTVIHSKNYTVNDKLNTLINKKISKIEKYFDDSATVTIVCSRIAKVEKMEVTITQKNRSFRAEVAGKNMFANIDVALSKIEKQIIKNKEKLRTILRKDALDTKKTIFHGKEPKFSLSEVLKQKSFTVSPLTEDDAEFALDTSDHGFYVYANKKSGKVNIMYRRADGNLGIIEVSNSTVK